MTLCGKPLRAFPQSLEIASRFPHSHRLDGCYTLSEFKLRKESSRTAFPNPSGSSFDWKRLLSEEIIFCEDETQGVAFVKELQIVLHERIEQLRGKLVILPSLGRRTDTKGA